VGNEPVTVLDTHAAVWWLSDPTKLSSKARRAIQTSATNGAVTLSAASVLEISTLVRRGRLELTVTVGEWLEHVESLPDVRIEPVTAEIALRAGSFDTDVHDDPIDRLIIATALALGTTLVSADERIRKLRWIRTIW
jgi:PIN domain nuclease of toxin-antitoxin system